MTKVDPLLSSEGRNRLLNTIMDAPPEDLERVCNIQLLNLLCADRLPGNENVDFRACLKRLDTLIDYIRVNIERYLRANGPSPRYSHCKYQTSMAALVTLMQREFGVTYSPKTMAELKAGKWEPVTDASEEFINGMLREDRTRRWGNCASIPVLVTAIARKLGYPVRLAKAKEHLYCRWEGQGKCFNIDASSEMGMAVLPDEHYRQFKGGPFPRLVENGYCFRQLTAAEEFGCFMVHRVGVLRDAHRLDETLFWSARALQYSPDYELFAHHACRMCDCVIQNRGLAMKLGPGSRERPDFSQLHRVTAPHERSPARTIEGHYWELNGQLELARNGYEAACQHCVYGKLEQRDLQRFLKKYNLPPKQRPLLPPKQSGLSRHFTFQCRPEEEADQLRHLTNHFEKRGELIKAWDALHDLYMFDPGDAEVFQRARALEKLPLFEEQMQAAMSRQQRGLVQTGATPDQPPSALKSLAAQTPQPMKTGPLNIVNFPRGRLTSN